MSCWKQRDAAQGAPAEREGVGAGLLPAPRCPQGVTRGLPGPPPAPAGGGRRAAAPRARRSLCRAGLPEGSRPSGSICRGFPGNKAAPGGRLLPGEAQITLPSSSSWPPLGSRLVLSTQSRLPARSQPVTHRWSARCSRGAGARPHAAPVLRGRAPAFSWAWQGQLSCCPVSLVFPILLPLLARRWWSLLSQCLLCCPRGLDLCSKAAAAMGKASPGHWDDVAGIDGGAWRRAPSSS